MSRIIEKTGKIISYITVEVQVPIYEYEIIPFNLTGRMRYQEMKMGDSGDVYITERTAEILSVKQNKSGEIS